MRSIYRESFIILSEATVVKLLDEPAGKYSILVKLRLLDAFHLLIFKCRWRSGIYTYPEMNSSVDLYQK